MTQDETDKLVELGDAAEMLLDTEVFSKTVNDLVDASFQQFSNSKPEEVDVRERSYHHYRALVEIVSTLQQRVAVRDQINAQTIDDNNQKGDE